LARLNPHGELDLDWAPNPDGEVRAIAMHGSDVFVGGSFYHIGGQDRQWLAKINTAGRDVVDSEWETYLYNFDCYYFFDQGVSSLAVDGTNLSWAVVLTTCITNRSAPGFRPGLLSQYDGCGQVDNLWTEKGFS
jgi:hypothetical protein